MTVTKADAVKLVWGGSVWGPSSRRAVRPAGGAHPKGAAGQFSGPGGPAEARLLESAAGAETSGL